MKIATLILMAMVPLAAQDIRLPASLDRLAAKAEESVDVTLDRSLLQLAARFLPDRDQDSAKVKRLIAGLEGVYVKSYQFASEGAYNMADVDSIRAQVQNPAWSRIVGVKSSRHSQDVDVYFKIIGGGRQIGGVVIIATEPRELTIVNIVGTLDPDELRELSGQFHIPSMDIRGWKRKDSQ